MALFLAGWIDGFKQVFPISLLGTSESPEEAERTTTGTATAGWKFKTDGTTDQREGAWNTDYDDWHDPPTGNPGNSYEIRATKESGTESSLGTGSLATWEALSSDISYILSNSDEDSSTIDIVLKIEIRDAQEQVVRGTGYYKISCTSQSGGGTTVTTVTTETTVTA